MNPERETPSILILVREDPEHSPRPAEALRVALGLRMEREKAILVLLGPAARSLAEDTSSFLDWDLLERYRRELALAGQRFRVDRDALAEHPPAPGFAVEPVGSDGLADLIARASSHILF